MCAASLLSCDAAHVFVEISYLPVSSVSIHVCGRLLVFPSLVLRVRSSTKCHSLPLQERFSSPLFFVWLHFLWFEPRTLAISITTNGGSMGTGGTPIPPAILATTERITISISTRISGLAVIPLLRADSTGILRTSITFCSPALPITTRRRTPLNRTIMFGGQTFDVGAAVSASVNSINIAPGYQYDIIRRDHGFLGLEIDLNFIETTAKLALSGNVNGTGGAVSGSTTFWAPLPDFGLAGRWYPLQDSNRLSFGGSFRGMPFFGYGNYMTGRADVGVGLTKHLNVRGGYEMGSRLSIHGTADQIAVQVIAPRADGGNRVRLGPISGPESEESESPTQRLARGLGSVLPVVQRSEWRCRSRWGHSSRQRELLSSLQTTQHRIHDRPGHSPKADWFVYRSDLHEPLV